MRVFKIMSKNAHAFRTTVGMSLQQFDFLIRDVEKIYPEAEQKRLDRPGRKRGVGAGRPFALHLWGNGTLALMYYRTYMIQDGMTRLFRISQGQSPPTSARLFHHMGMPHNYTPGHKLNTRS